MAEEVVESPAIPAASTAERAEQPVRTVPNLLLFVGFFVVLVAKAALVRHFVLDAGSFSSTLALEGLFIAALLSPVEVFADRRFLGYLVVDVLVSVFFAIVVVYAGYFDRVIALDAVRFAGQMGDVGASIRELFKPVYLLFFADIPLLAAFGWLRLRRSAVWWRPGRSNSTMTTAFVVVWVVIVGMVWTLAARSQVGGSKDLAAQYGLLRYQVSALFAGEGTPVKADVDVSDPAALKAAIAELKGVPENGTPVSPLAGIAKGRNVIVIQVESMGAHVVGAQVDGVQITPRIDELSEEALYFPNTYFQVGMGGTSDAEFMFNSSLYSRPDLASAEMVAGKSVPALPRLLRDAGYATVAFHANEKSFWNRDVLFPALGFDSFYDIEFFGEKDMIGIGPSDEVLFADSMPVLQERFSAGAPVYAYYITVTPHHPFELPPEKVRLKLPARYDDTLVGDYFTAMNYEDYCIGQFVDRLREAGVLEDSVIVVMGDHFGLDPETIGAQDAKLLEEVLGRPYTMADKMRVPLLVYVPGIEGERIERTVGQVDVFPTLAELLGLDVSGVPLFGKSALAEAPDNLLGERYYLPPGSYIDESTIFIPGASFDDGTVYDARSGEETASASASRDNFERVVELMSLSDAYVSGLSAASD